MGGIAPLFIEIIPDSLQTRTRCERMHKPEKVRWNILYWF